MHQRVARLTAGRFVVPTASLVCHTFITLPAGGEDHEGPLREEAVSVAALPGDRARHA